MFYKEALIVLFILGLVCTLCYYVDKNTPCYFQCTDQECSMHLVMVPIGKTVMLQNRKMCHCINGYYYQNKKCKKECKK